MNKIPKRSRDILSRIGSICFLIGCIFISIATKSIWAGIAVFFLFIALTIILTILKVDLVNEIKE